MSEPSDHKDVVREEFTKQADAYAANSILTDSEKVKRLVQATNAHPEAQVLEVATGPGHVAFEFAKVSDEVVGIDITEAPLEIARKKKQERDIENIHFQKGDGEDIPFPENTFDIVACRLALHHVEAPSNVVKEMSRVCRPEGTVAIDDIVVSEYSKRGKYQNKFERLRDPSHVRALPVSEILEIFTENNLEIIQIETGKLVQEVEEWLDNAETPPTRASEAREMVLKDAKRDLSGTHPYFKDNDLHFTQRTAVIAGKCMS
ncbi:class I SAM-dependent methyltransferase [Halocatena halophila]|uniref:class I SAM-dependent methyltransferase n=1 Tax=Halocatena halophila TaxID=2814576 RepID=UPI002ED04D39